jgi:hypothetical protein
MQDFAPFTQELKGALSGPDPQPYSNCALLINADLCCPIKTINCLKTANCDTCYYLKLSQLDYWFVYFV